MTARGSGDSTDYDGADEAALEAELDDAWSSYDGTGGADHVPATGTPTTMRVDAQVEWAGVLDRARNGQRTVNLDQLDTRRVRDALTAARRSADRAGSAGQSLTAKGWEAQLKELVTNRRGQDATDRAGLSPTRATLIKWLSGDQVPSAGNQRRIAAAYSDVRGQLVSEARSRADQTRHLLAEAVNETLRERYGADIRLRNIQSIQLS